MAKVIRNRWVYRPHGKWFRYLPRRNDAVKEYNYEENDGTIEHFRRTLDVDDTAPNKLWVAWLYRDLSSEPKWTKQTVAKLFGVDQKVGRMKVLLNVTSINEDLWKVKHLIELRPITFPNGEPTEDDVYGSEVSPNGVCKIIEPNERENRELVLFDKSLHFSNVDLKKQLARKYFGYREIFEKSVYQSKNIVQIN